MREIKFRAWHKNGSHNCQKGEGEMIHYNPIGIHFFADGKGDMPGIAENNTGCNEFFDCSDIQEDFILMQYTGIKDKDGVDIYEGDIVKILYTDRASKTTDDARTIDEYLYDIARTRVVIWSVQGFYVSNKVGGYAETMEPGTHGYIQVIGNIYENPELL